MHMCVMFLVVVAAAFNVLGSSVCYFSSVCLSDFSAGIFF